MAIKLGDKDISKIMLGDRPIKKVMLGDRLVWHKQGYIIGTAEPNVNVIIKLNNIQRTAHSDADGNFSLKVDYEITSLQSALQESPNDIKSIDFSFVDLSKVINMTLFARNSTVGAIKGLDNLKDAPTSEETTYGSIFRETKNLKEIIAPNVIFNGYYIFYNSDIETIKIKGLYLQNISAFQGASKLKNIEIESIEVSSDFSSSPLTLQSAINVLDALQPVTTAQTITFSAYTTSLINASNNALAKVYDAVQKGWTIVGEGMKDYVELEYIESTGTQYIPLNDNFQANKKYEVKIALTTTEIGDTKIFGQVISGSEGAMIATLNKKWRLLAGWNWRLKDDIDTEIHTFKFDVSTNLKFQKDNDAIETYSIRLSTDNTLALFAQLPSTSYLGRFKLYDYNVQNTTTNEVEKKLVPAKRMSDGAIGMIDKISGQWYGNSGTGTFIGGEPKQD